VVAAPHRDDLRGDVADPGRGPSASRVLAEPVVVVTATGTVVVPLTS